ncbi:MAG: hypothetical protein V1645_00080 [archaeon]
MKHHLRRPISWVIIGLIVVLVVILIIPLTTRNEIPPGPGVGSECVADSDCPAYRCPGVKAACIGGFCKPVDLKGEVTRCIDLRNPVCGNGVCEGDEKDGSCPRDCA